MKEQSAAEKELSILINNDDEELNHIFNEDKSSSPLQRNNQELEGPKIPKVPDMLRKLKTNEGCFDPRVVSIGPYHHGNPELQEVEKLKTKLAKQYCGNPSAAAELYRRVKEVAGEARGFYDMEGLDIDDKAFTKIMFLDGCFILVFITCLVGEAEYHAMGMKNNVIANVKRDLFLLENQLPYIVLKALMDKRQYWKMMIEIFITICRRLPPPVLAVPWWSSTRDKSPLHLLDMTRTRFVNQSATNQGRKSSQILLETDAKQFDRSRSILIWSNDWYSYHSARVLQSMGIWFKPNKTGSFSDVKFESQLVRGVLTLPPILIDASTKSVLLNLLAFESSHNNLADMQGVTSYMCFMDSLIDHAEDVMILRSQNVIVNCLGTDQQVADLFNDIASNLVPNPHTYAEAKRGIQKHCNNQFKKWMAECLHTHFRSPWTLLALGGAIFVIMLTAAQTYLAARPPKTLND
ncbi:UPF0481 protein At3g47200-like [Ziziphus jujuba]|uniref:UPF0481 protein At3g47200-like n=1 Tax=Ziziphus jujuba TaxID=326968 RepID=A0A6P4ACQ0_ZIZJJ|nr:UPF0481 protein At3g47200-like [Ziziphus jujuba]